MSSLNPGISAAGEAAWRTALNPSAGPAAIGGMLVSGGDSEVEPSDQLTLQTRLTAAVSDITKLANAMEALSMNLTREGSASDEETSGRLGGVGQPSTVAATPDSAVAGGTTSMTHGRGAVGGVTTNIGSCAIVSSAALDTHRQAMSQHRM